MNKKLKLTELGRLSMAEYAEVEKIPVVVVLDNIRSGNNVGSLFRTADAFRIKELVLCGITPKPPHRDISKTALGASESVDWQYHDQTVEAVQYLKAEGYTIVSVEQAEHTVKLSDWEIDPTSKIAIVLGNEVKGVEQQVIDESDLCVEIPQYGTKHSLNVSICVGILMWHAAQSFLGLE